MRTKRPVKDLTGGGVHHSFEAVGMKVTAEQSFSMLRSGGQATLDQINDGFDDMKAGNVARSVILFD